MGTVNVGQGNALVEAELGHARHTEQGSCCARRLRAGRGDEYFREIVHVSTRDIQRSSRPHPA